jgi:hypothetical protein
MFLRSAALAAVILASPAAAAPTCDDLLQATRAHQETFLQLAEAVQTLQGVLRDHLGAGDIPVRVADDLRVRGLEPLAADIVAALGRLEAATRIYRQTCGA